MYITTFFINSRVCQQHHSSCEGDVPWLHPGERQAQTQPEPGVCGEGQPGCRKVPCLLDERKQHSTVGKGVAICTASEKYYLPQGNPPDTI